MPLSLPKRLQFPTEHLPLTEDFQYVGEESYKYRLELAHRRAKAMALAHGNFSSSISA